MFGLIVEGKKALLVIAAMSLPALVPAGNASAASGERVLVYKITRASGFIRADFDGAQNDGCQQRGVCGYSGTVMYPFRGPPRPAGSFLLLDKPSRFAGGRHLRPTAATLGHAPSPRA